MKADPVHAQKKEGGQSPAGRRPASSHGGAFNPIALLSRSTDEQEPQAKLTVDAANDPFEREADTVAKAVVSESAVPPVRERAGRQIGTQSIGDAINRALLHKAEEEDAQLESEEEAQTLRRAEEDEVQSLRLAEDEEAQTLRRSEDEEAQTSLQREEENDAQARRQEDDDASVQGTRLSMFHPRRAGSSAAWLQREQEDDVQSQRIGEDESTQQLRLRHTVAARAPPGVGERLSLQDEEENAAQASYACRRARALTKGADAGAAEGGVVENSRLERMLQASRSSGTPMDRPIRTYMEGRFSADFGVVRIHTDDRAVMMCQMLGARAFASGAHVYFNRGQYDDRTDKGRTLLAHELVHTLQQGAASPRGPPAITRSPSSVQRTTGLIQRIPFGGRINEYANDVPGWRLLTVIVGYNPLTEKNVPRTAANFLGGILALMPGGSRLFDKLNEHGVVDRAFAWLEAKRQEIGLTYDGIVRLAEEAWDEMKLIEGFDYNFQIVKRKVVTVINRIVSFGAAVVKKVVELVREKLAPPLVEWIKTKTRAYPLLTVILGKDPVTGKAVPRTLSNIVRGFLMLTETGESYWNKLVESGKLAQVSAWLEKTIAKYNISADRIVTAFTTLWESLSWSDILDPIGLFGKIYNAFAQPVADILAFLLEVVAMVFKLIKEYFLGLLKKHAHGIPGYPLLTVILERDPLTGEKVPRTAKNFIKGFMSFVPGGLEKYKNLEKSGAIDKAFAWLQKEVIKLDLTWTAIKLLFSKAWDLLSIESFLKPIETFTALMDIFAAPVFRIIRFAVNVGLKILEFVFIGVLGPTGARVLAVLKKAKSTFISIIKNPIGFLGNLLKSLGLGFKQFSTNIFKHLLNGLMGWLFGALEGAGIQLPEKWDLKGIVSLVLQILGLTWERLRAKLVKRIGEEKVKRLEQTFEFIKILVTEGVAGVWRKIVEYVEGLKEKVIEGVRNWVVTKIVTIAVQKLATLWNPVGAVIESIIAIYNTIMFFIERINQILDLVEAVVDSIANIVAGKLDAAANYVEQAMARTIPVIISFLARLIGLGGISDAIKKVIGKIQDVVDKGIDKLLDWVEKQAKSLVGKGKAVYEKGKAAVKGVLSWWQQEEPLATKDGKNHTIGFEGSGKNAKLVIHSDTDKYSDYLATVKTTYNLTDDQIKPAMTKAREIESEKSKTVPADQEQAHGQKIADLVKELADLTKALPLVSSGTNTAPVFGPLHNGWGTLARVSYQESPHDEGSEPRLGNTPEYNDINIRRKDSGSFYVKGHLLNENLGGPGNTWSNLTPISQKANGDHKRDFENPVKLAVNGKTAGYSATKLGSMENFAVQVIYGRPSLDNLIYKLEETDDTVPGLQPSDDRMDAAKILRAEQWVPTRLDCSAEITDKNGKTKKLSKPIENDIQYGKLQHYQLNSSPKSVYRLVDGIDFSRHKDGEDISIAEMNTRTAKLQLLKLIGPDRARRIYQRFVESGRILSYLDDIGMGKKALEDNNPRYRISTGVKP